MEVHPRTAIGPEVYQILLEPEIDVLAEFRLKLEEIHNASVYADIYDLDEDSIYIHFSKNQKFENILENIVLNRETLTWDFI
ncbi:hypothetical protein ACF3N7_07210 [Cruoricaptor ignavus]|uniref:hypothetical protein n=1 Tax=Cruoricaptor ignavus TaxID=1118202 RepID=UPI00370DC7AB